MHAGVAPGSGGPAYRYAERFRARARAEDGFTLVEVLVTAVLVALVAIGIFAGLDGASATSGRNKARAVAAGLAQQDLERLRGMKVSSLSNLRETNTQSVAGVSYTIKSRSDWITDSSGTASCTSSDAKADFLKITSTITWPAMGSLKPVVSESLVAPPNGSFATNQGSLAVQLRDRNAAGVGGLQVSLNGPPSFSDFTNSLGCVLWGFLPAGNYTVNFSQAGYVNPQGVSAVSQPVSVVGESTNTVSYDYDRAGEITVSFDTKVGAAAPQAAQSGTASVAHSSLAAPGTRVFGSGTPATTIAATNLFPFTSAYGVYAGDCVGADPRTYGQAAGMVTVSPAGAHTATVRMPALNLNVTRGGTPLNNARVRTTATATGCGGTSTSFTNSSGKLTNPGFPYGTYNVCADDGTRKFVVNGVSDTNPAGSATVNLPVPTSGTTGTCP